MGVFRLTGFDAPIYDEDSNAVDSFGRCRFADTLPTVAVKASLDEPRDNSMAVYRWGRANRANFAGLHKVVEDGETPKIVNLGL